MAPPPAAPETHGLSLRSRLDAATMAILQTRDQVVRSLDKHLAELHSLRRALSDADSPMVSQAAPTGSTPTPQASTEVAPPVSVTILPPPPSPAPGPKPLMTQVVWPSAPSTTPTAENTASPHPHAPIAPPPAVINALQGLQDVLLQKVPLTPPPMPMSAVFPDQLPALPDANPAAQRSPVVLAASPFELATAQPATNLNPTAILPQAPHSTMQQAPMSGAREVLPDPKIDQATLEDLNTALAYAFSQAASNSPVHSAGPMTSVIHPATAKPAQQGASQQWQLPPRH